MGNYPSLLVIDDEPDNFDVIETLLSNENYELHYAASGQEAIADLDTFNPDLILLDVMMPGMDGMTVCKHIKAIARWQPVPIIMVTALTSKDDLARCLKAGADDFISKPVNALELRARVQSMLRIKQQYDHLQAFLKLREDMVHMVVHDLRNPLTSILLGLDILEGLELSPDKKKAQIAQIRSSSQHLQSLIDDLLLMARLEAGQIKLNRSDTKLPVLFQSSLRGFRNAALQKNIELVIQTLDHSNSYEDINVDRSMFQRVIDNLLSNAIKFSPRHSQIILTGDIQDTGTTIQVIDSGMGVPSHLRQKIFEKFETGTLMEDVSQIGIGLAFCKLVVEAHKGSILVKDNVPKGSIFEIFLPHI